MVLFNKEMSIELARLVDEHNNDLFPEKGRAQSHQVSVKAWQAITDHISGQFPKSSVTVKQVKERVEYMKKMTADSISAEKRSYNRTGGGSPERSDSPAQETVKNLMLNAFGQSFQKVPGGVASDLFGESETSSKRPREFGEESSSASLETPKFREKVSRPPSRASNLEDLQRSVLEIELENAQKISQILLRIPSILDKSGPIYQEVEDNFIVESEKFFRNL
ncbi:hypothetical protein GPALN_014767 [Globodera pallida]|nr:hypothetical protein GPALN_014767 [Globodera pallida]